MLANAIEITTPINGILYDALIVDADPADPADGWLDLAELESDRLTVILPVDGFVEVEQARDQYGTAAKPLMNVRGDTGQGDGIMPRALQIDRDMLDSADRYSAVRITVDSPHEGETLSLIFDSSGR